MHKYVYEGPVMAFDKRIVDYWTGITYAVSAKKARSNLAYQFKRKNNLMPQSRITLPGDIYVKE